MQKRMSCLLLSVAMMATLSVHAGAAEGETSVNGADPAPSTAIEVTAPVKESDGIGVLVNGVRLPANTATKMVDGIVYVSYWPVMKALYPEATVAWENDQSMSRANGIVMGICPNAKYIVANGRYLYVPDRVITEGAHIMIPARVLCKALGAEMVWDSIHEDVLITTGTGPIESADTAYNSEDLYWLSHIIYAESGNQPLEGKIAVGNVVMNRAASSRFPNSIEGVIFQRNQFSPARSGSIYRDPNWESVVAAKLCLDGANTVGNSLYFFNPRNSPNCWASRNRTYVATIGGHAFFA